MTVSLTHTLAPGETILAEGDVSNISPGRRIVAGAALILVWLAVAAGLFTVFSLRGLTPLQSGMVTAVFVLLPLCITLPMSILVKGPRQWIVTDRRIHFDTREPLELADIRKLRHGRTLVLKSGHEIHLRGARDRTALRAALRNIQP
ncbi:MAG: hypothetical protein CVT80_14865 [Alphaproteobacteria bacterium HGW-Alphaproteobacteria-2]|nr:MAG: hypothetical protein CVT80_14865 [Alphaproteobacteria bacterium HGW-Alphaproteobacteria-2]